MEIFQTDVNGQAREYRKLMARRNYVAIVAYDPETLVSLTWPEDLWPLAGT
jgi:hypothetical protein